MITHVVMFRWHSALTEQQLVAVRSAFDDLRSIEGVKDLEHGADLSIRPTNADYVTIVRFAEWDVFMAYVAHPKHRYLAEDLTAEFTESRWSVQFESSG